MMRAQTAKFSSVHSLFAKGELYLMLINFNKKVKISMHYTNKLYFHMTRKKSQKCAIYQALVALKLADLRAAAKTSVRKSPMHMPAPRNKTPKAVKQLLNPIGFPLKSGHI